MSGLLPVLSNPEKEREIALERAALLAKKAKSLIADINRLKREHYEAMLLCDEELARKTDEIEYIEKEINSRENKLKILLEPHTKTVKAWEKKYKKQNLWLTEKVGSVSKREKDADESERQITEDRNQIEIARTNIEEQENALETREGAVKVEEKSNALEASILTLERETFEKQRKTRTRELNVRERSLRGRETILERTKRAYKDLKERLEKEYTAKDKDIKSRYSALMNAEKELK